MKPTKQTSPKVVAPETWCVHSPYGALKSLNGDYLERLEAVHALLMQRDGLASAEAAVRVFGPFIFDANSALGMKHGAAKLRAFLHIADPSERASSAIDIAGRLHMEEAAELVPYVPHHRLDRGTPEALLYAIGVMAGEVWAPHSADVDVNARLDGYCAEGYFPSAAKCREIVGPLAVPFALAHSLWGWGHVSEVVPLHAVDAVVSSGVTKGTNADDELRALRKWTPERLELLASDFSKAPGKTVLSRRQAVASIWKTTESNVKKHLIKASKGKKAAPKPASPWVALFKNK